MMFCFRPIAIGALLTTVLACTLILVRVLMDYSSKKEDVDYGSPSLLGTFKAFATIMFVFGGASTFPTIQADMREPNKFYISAITSCTS